MLQLAWPIVLAQVATATTGVVDTAVIGSTGDETQLAAVALAAVTFSFLYWGFGFLRMATTGLTAQAQGGGGRDGPRTVLQRGLGLGLGFGVALMLAFPLLRMAALGLFTAESAVEQLTGAYLDARIWGAPAALMGFAVNGWLLGMGRTRALLGFQVVLNGTNGLLDAWFVTQWDLGPAGIGAGTAIAEWVALGVGLWLVRDGLVRSNWREGPSWHAMLAVNRDVMIRTLALLFAFAWFTNAGTRLGSSMVAANQVLLQFIAVSAFVLDAFAFVTEKEVGEAVGAGDPGRLRRALRITTELAAVFGLLFSTAYALLGPGVIEALVADPAPRDLAIAYLPYAAVVPTLGVAAWQLDGVFLGATQGRALRNAAVVTTVVYVALDLALVPLGAWGLWVAFLSSYVLRALTLGVALPRLLYPAP